MFLKKFDKRNISGLQSPSRKKQKIVAVFPDEDCRGEPSVGLHDLRRLFLNHKCAEMDNKKDS